MTDYFSVKEAAAILRVSRQEVVRKIWVGIIKADKPGRDYVIPKSEIERIRRDRGGNCELVNVYWWWMVSILGNWYIASAVGSR